MIMASVLLLVGLFINAAAQAAGRSYADAVFDLAGRSVLSEYDRELQKRYGIFAVHTDEDSAEKKLKYYADYSFHDNYLKEILRGRSYTDALKLKLDSVHVNLKGYSMTDTGLFQQQILNDMKSGILKGGDRLEGERPEQGQDIALRNEQIINGLPSKGYKSGFFTDLKWIAENGIPSLSEIAKDEKDCFLVNEYILGHFLNRSKAQERRDTFFQNEAEYILKGNFSDAQNYSGVRSDLFIVRNVSNLAHIFSDPEKRNQVLEIAAALTLGEGAEIGAPVVAEAWAAAESENDLLLLEAGKKVAFIKNSENWAVPVSSSLEYLWTDEYRQPAKATGYDYEDYLRVLLFLENREQKLLRCMDLIQLNMKGGGNRDFDLKEYYGGFQFEAVVKDKKFTYIQKY